MHSHMTVLLKMMYRAFGGINGNMGKIRSTQPFDLGIEIGKISSLEQWIFGLFNPLDNILGAECHLFGLGEEIVHYAIKDHPANDS